MLYEGLVFQGFLWWQLIMVEQSIVIIKIQKEILYSVYPELRISSEK
jgi:hypothetical protein